MTFKFFTRGGHYLGLQERYNTWNLHQSGINCSCFPSRARHVWPNFRLCPLAKCNRETKWPFCPQFSASDCLTMWLVQHLWPLVPLLRNSSLHFWAFSLRKATLEQEPSSVQPSLTFYLSSDCAVSSPLLPNSIGGPSWGIQVTTRWLFWF